MAVSALAVSAIPVNPVAAAGPSGSYSSGITCVNLSSSSASLAITFYSADNATPLTTYSVPSALPPKTNVILFTPSIPGLPASLQGSAVVSSDQQVGCTADSQLTSGTPGTVANPARIATSESFDASQAASTLYATQLVKTLGNATSGVYDSYVAVQNIESTPVSVTISYVDRFGTNYPAANETAVIPPQSSHYFYQSDNANLPGGFLGSGTIVASDSIKKLAATIVMYNSGGVITKSQMQAYNAVATGAAKITVPQFVRNYYGYHSGANIMNIGATTTTVTSTFTFPGPNVYVRTDVIGPKKVLAIFAPNIAQLAGVDALPTNQRTGAAVFQADPGGLIVGNANLRNDGVCYGAAVSTCGTVTANQVGLGQSLNAFVSGTETNKAIISRYPKRFGGEVFNGGFVIANATGTAGTCDIEFVGNTTQTAVPLPANGTIGRFATGVSGLPDGTQNPVSIVCTQPVFVNANSRADLPTYWGDSGSSWNVANIP